MISLEEVALEAGSSKVTTQRMSQESAVMRNVRRGRTVLLYVKRAHVRVSKISRVLLSTDKPKNKRTPGLKQLKYVQKIGTYSA